MLINLNLKIKINQNRLLNDSALAVAKTILHESIHAYLMVKYFGCNQGTPFDSIDDIELSELLNEYYLECVPQQEQHEFMFNYMIPTMSEILADIRDDLVPENHQLLAQEEMFINEENPEMDSFGDYVLDTPWNWNDFYKYFSMGGLDNSSAFHLEIGDAEPIEEQTPEYKNFARYNSIGTNSFEDDCND